MYQVGHFSVVAGRGSNESEMATNICKLLLSPALATMLNWVGTTQKVGIKDLKTGALIIGNYLIISFILTYFIKSLVMVQTVVSVRAMTREQTRGNFNFFFNILSFFC